MNNEVHPPRPSSRDTRSAARPRRGLAARGILALAALGGVVATAALVTSVSSARGGGQTQLPTTIADFFQPGTQPDPSEQALIPIVPAMNCTFCHSEYGVEVAPYDTWVASLMAQSARDPIWHAALAIANQDANVGGETCIRCHAPGAWLGGRSATGTTENFTPDDFDGINCHFCHRAVNPVLGEGSAIGYPGDPAEPDVPIISALQKQGLIPVGAGNARYIIDPADNRRGPFDDVPLNLHGSETKLITSPYHRTSEFCGSCHDVSNPLYSKNKKGEYVLNALGSPHPTQDPMDMYPEQRTYSEWLHSAFPNGVAYPDGRFGGNDPDGIVSSCQDCHMPKVIAGGCRFSEFGDPWFERPDMPQHSFAGANTWVVQAIRNIMGPEEADGIGLTQERIDEASARTVAMLQAASDMTLTQSGSDLRVRITNESGHKLPSGYPEGRRMWLNVKFKDAKGAVIAERGAYDSKTATLAEKGTKIYQAKHGITPSVSKLTGIPAGPGFHLALANKVFFDNRIPPRGFTNAAFDAIGSGAVGYTYADGQHWDDTNYPIPTGAVAATVTLYYQTTTREYIEFLRDANVTNDAGQVAYNAWVEAGKSAPVAMDTATITLTVANPADLNGDGIVNGSDLTMLLASWGPCAAPCAADLTGDGIVNGSDLTALLANWS